MPTLQQTSDEWLDESFKGYPTGREPMRVGQAGQAGLSLLAGDLPMPVAVLRESALAHNSRWIKRFIDETGVSLAPHGKTTLAPQIFADQLSGGCWGITVGTVHHALIAAQMGAPRVLMANQLAGAEDAQRWLGLVARHPNARFLSLVDSLDQLKLLQQGAEQASAANAKVASAVAAGRFEVLVELGRTGGRTGCRTVAGALEVARAVKASGQLRLAGVESYEGVSLQGNTEHDNRLVRDWMAAMIDLARACDAEGLFETDEILVSAGGSAVYDLVADSLASARLSRATRVVLRSGCYITHDHGNYQRAQALVSARALTATARGEGFKAALEVWGAVQSRPEPELAILTFGRRDLGQDGGFPTPLHWFRRGEHTLPQTAAAHWKIDRMMDQHAFLRLQAGDPLRVGDWVAVGISHPCTTFDKWRLIWGVDDQWRVQRAVRTYF